MIKNLITIIFIFNIIIIFAQPANDDCANATNITVLDGTCQTGFTTTAASIDAAPANYTVTCQDQVETVWFSFTAQGGLVDITVTSVNSNGNAEISLMDATAGDPCDVGTTVPIGCADDNGNYGSITLTNNGLTVGNIYYIQVTMTNQDDFEICIDNPAPPANDDCSSPEPIATLDGTCVSGTTTSASSDPYSGTCWTGANYDNMNTVWYSFVAQGIQADIIVSGAISSYPAFAIYSVTSGGDICTIGDVALLDCQALTLGVNGVSSSGTGYPLTIGETYFVAVTMRDDFDGDFDICIDNPVASAGDNCFSANPFCTGSTETFPANTNTTVIDNADFDCLLSQANPIWYYMEVATAGDIEITVTNSNTVDIDYIIWGPFADVASGCDPGLTTSVEDCSFSAASTEVANITGASIGEVYIMLITNFSNSVTDITFSQTAGTGATDCALLPVSLLNFNAANIDNYNLIDWATASELNSDYFTLDYSTDAKNWITIDYISAAGNSNTQENYQYRHQVYSDGISYYRLSQTDYNGNVNYYMMTNVNNSKDGVKIINIVNMMGQEVDENYKGLRIITYSDGTTIKKVGK